MNEGSSRAIPEVYRFRARGGWASPASYAQQTLWSSVLRFPDRNVFNTVFAYRLTGRLNVDALRHSLQVIVDRHEALRTSFLLDDELYQVVDDHVTIDVPLTALGDVDEDEQRQQLERIRREERDFRFDLMSRPLIRFRLVRLTAAEHVLIVNAHRIILDFWSLGILVRELTVVYRQLTAGEPWSLPRLPIRYADFAAWQREWAAGPACRAQLEYWKSKLADAPTLLDLLPRAEQASAGEDATDSFHFRLGPDLEARTRLFARQQGVTLYAFLLAVFQLLVLRYSERSDFVVGTLNTNRQRVELEGVMGFFVDMLPIRADLSGNPKFLDHLAHTRDTLLEALDHCDVPFEKLLAELKPKRHAARNPLVQVVFAMQNTPRETLDLPELTVALLPTRQGTSPFDLMLSMHDGQIVGGHFEYQSALFREADVRRMCSDYLLLLERALTDPAAPAFELAMRDRPQLSREVDQQESAPDGTTVVDDLAVSHRRRGDVSGDSPLQRGDEPREAVDGEPQLRSQEALVGTNESLSPLERSLSEMWADILGVPAVRIDDNFFDLGGHSFLAIQVISEVLDTYGVEIQLVDFFDGPTIQELGRLIAAHGARSPEAGG